MRGCLRGSLCSFPQAAPPVCLPQAVMWSWTEPSQPWQPHFLRLVGHQLGSLRKVNIWGNHSLTVCRLIRHIGTHAHTHHTLTPIHSCTCASHTPYTLTCMCAQHTATHTHTHSLVCTCITHSHMHVHTVHIHTHHTLTPIHSCVHVHHTQAHTSWASGTWPVPGCPCSIASEPPLRSVLETMPHHLLAYLASAGHSRGAWLPSSC